MKSSRKETEVKLRFPSYADAVARIESVGATRVHDRSFEDNIVYDTAERGLSASDRLLRLREAGGRTTLTFKGPAEANRRHKVRVEHETSIDDAAAAREILTGIGLQPVWRYQKFRASYEADGVEICVDETAVGCFVELEGPGEAIDALAARLGMTEDDYVLSSYRDLAIEAGEDGRPADLLIE